MGIRIDKGHLGDQDLSCLYIGMDLDIPGNMGRGNRKVAAFAVAPATRGRVREVGRVWDFDGPSAEICQIDRQ